MKVKVFVRLKNGVLDPQGKAIHQALGNMGFDGVSAVRCGRLLDLDVTDNVTDDTLRQMCEKLLANTVIEDFEIIREAQ